jgi:hypothetical protein
MTDEIPPEEVPLRDEVPLPRRGGPTSPPAAGDPLVYDRTDLHPPLSAYTMRWGVGACWFIGLLAALASIGQLLILVWETGNPILSGVFTFLAFAASFLGRWLNRYSGRGPWFTGTVVGSMVLVPSMVHVLWLGFGVILYGLGVALLPGLARGFYEWASAANSLRKLRLLEAEEKLRLAGRLPRPTPPPGKIVA